MTSPSFRSAVGRGYPRGVVALTLSLTALCAVPAQLHAAPAPAKAAETTAGSAAPAAAAAPAAPADKARAAEEQKLVAEAGRLGGKPEGVLPLLELWERWDVAQPARVRAALEQLAKDKRLSPSRGPVLRAAARALRTAR